MAATRVPNVRDVGIDEHSFLGGTPTGRVLFACVLTVRDRTDGGPDLGLFVTLDRRLGRPAAFFAPHERYLSAHVAVRDVNDPERQHRALVEAVAAEGREADQLAALQ